MRHTHAVLFTNGADIYYVAQRLGHSVQVCESTYAKIIPGGLRAGVRRSFADVISGG